MSSSSLTKYNFVLGWPIPFAMPGRLRSHIFPAKCVRVQRQESGKNLE